MAGMSDFLEAQILVHLFRTGTLAKPGNVYATLHTADPGDTGSSEVTGGAYARKAIPTGDANWTAPANVGGVVQTSNVGAVAFATPTADWGYVAYSGLADALTAGNFWTSGVLDGVAQILALDSPPAFAAGALKVGESGLVLSNYAKTALLNHLLRTAALTKPTTWYMSLHGADPGTTGANEVASVGGYERAAAPTGDANWTAPTASGGVQQITNLAAIGYPAATLDWGAGPVTHAGFWDAATGGNFWLGGALGISRVVLAGNSGISFGAGSITIGKG